MSANNQAGPAFLSELAEDVVITASMLAMPLTGPNKARETVMNLGSLYASRDAPVMAVVGKKTLVQYDATLLTGEAINAITVLTRNDSDEVVEINIGYLPMQSVEALAKNYAEAFGQSPSVVAQRLRSHLVSRFKYVSLIRNVHAQERDLAQSHRGDADVPILLHRRRCQ